MTPSFSYVRGRERRSLSETKSPIALPKKWMADERVVKNKFYFNYSSLELLSFILGDEGPVLIPLGMESA
jgi:hypothetical protein